MGDGCCCWRGVASGVPEGVESAAAAVGRESGAAAAGEEDGQSTSICPCLLIYPDWQRLPDIDQREELILLAAVAWPQFALCSQVTREAMTRARRAGGRAGWRAHADAAERMCCAPNDRPVVDPGGRSRRAGEQACRSGSHDVPRLSCRA